MTESIGPRAARLLDAPGLAADARGYVHPRREEDLQAIVRHARANGLGVRVRGAAHSVPLAIHSDARVRGAEDAGPGMRARAIELMLDRYAAVTFDDARRRVTVQGGCRFGRDPRDPTGAATIEAGLCHQLEQRGWALPNLAGVSHTTVAGLLATGASGGSATRSLPDCVVALRIVDGTGEIRELSRDADPDAFHAALVSLGLFGIVSTITLACVPRFDVLGSESVTTLDEAPFDAEGTGPRSLEAFLRDTDYARILWWPQQGVDKLVVWRARPMVDSDYDDETGPPWALRPRPYRPFDPVLGSTLPLQAAAGAALSVLGGWRAGLEQIAGKLAGATLARLAERFGAARAEAALIDAFVPKDAGAPRAFWDSWWRSLPMDDDIDERLLPTTFTEIWLPLRATGEAMRRLRDLYRRDARAAGSFVVEIYAAPPSAAWLSPAHGEAMVRFNFFWLTRNPGDPRETYFPVFWELLADLGLRLHWAKLLPLDARETARRLEQSYPRWRDFAAMRARFDPDGVFLTSYWRAFLGLDGEHHDAPAHPRAFEEPDGSPRKWPAWFAMARTDPTFVERAEHVIEVNGHVPAPPALVHCTIASMHETHAWVPAYVRTDWLSEESTAEGAVFEEVFVFMTIRMRVVESVPGERWAASVLACSLPLGTAMGIRIDFTEAPDGGTDVRWRVGYDLPASLGPLDPLVSPLFRQLFQQSVEGLARYLGRRGNGARR